MYETPVSRSVYKNTVERVLIVDPETVDRQLVSMALLEEAPGLNITEAQNLMQGAASLAHGACDVVVAHWPQGTSWSSLYKDAAPRIKRLPWVVLLDTYDQHQASIALAGGAQDVLGKHNLNGAALLQALKHARSRHLASRMKLKTHKRLNALGRLASGVAHELGNPAAMLNNNLHSQYRELTQLAATLRNWKEHALSNPSTEHRQHTKRLLKERQPQEQLSETLKMLDESTRAIDRIVFITRQLRTLAHIRSDSIAEVSINHIVLEAAGLLQPHLPPNVRLIERLREVPGLELDRYRILQVTISLMFAALQSIDIHKSDARIRLSTQQRKGNVLVRIEATGGNDVSVEERAKIFQSSSENKAIEPSIGVGLSICADIIEQHQGQIDIDDSPLGGIRFTIYLPCQRVEH